MKNIPSEYRTIPFWSWNEKLNVEETERQVELMHEKGIGGFFMHARGGLETEYMGKEWFDNIEAAIKTAEKYGMKPWAYDEFGWPSGFGSGKVNALGIEYQQKFLRMEKEPLHEKEQIAKCGDYYFYYEVNPYYIDVLNASAVKEFIKCSYEPYYSRYKNRIEGFFTDEPQISRNGIPWSFLFEEEYKRRYGENILSILDELFTEKGNYKRTRIKFWKMVTDMFSKSYFEEIYLWCSERGLKFSGHLVLEENMNIQITASGACMPHYEYMHIPGIDWLRRPIYDCLTALQVSSVAEQMGKEAVIAEIFALCGHNVSMANLKGTYEWLMVQGINLLCQHLEGYSMRGIRKRDYPPAMFYQQPWWDDYGKWIDAVSLESMVMRQSESRAQVLLLHPQTTAWSMFDGNENKGITELNERFLREIKKLEKKHVSFHLGDEIVLQRHAKVKNGKLIVGNQSYTYVIMGECRELLDSTEAILMEFKKQGGKIVSTDYFPESDLVSDKEIKYKLKYKGNNKIHFFTNSTPDEKSVKIKVNGKKLNIYSGKWEEFSGVHDFEPWGSLLLLEDGSENLTYIKAEENYIYPEGEFKIISKDLNLITLDKCDYYFDEELQEENGYVLNICERANKLEREVQIRWVYKVKAKYKPEKLYLITETPEKFNIKVNGIEINKKVQGYYKDISFKKIDIAEYFTEGENEITFNCSFIQSQRFYEHLKRAKRFEGEINMLYYDIEIEPVYLLGDFSVKTDGKWQKLERNDYRYTGEFIIDKPVNSLVPKNIEQKGFPFFSGEMILEGEIDVQGKNPVLNLKSKGINVIGAIVGDINETKLTDYKISLASLGNGKRKLRLRIVNNLHNMMGPHHLEVGQSYIAGPFCFYKEDCVWSKTFLSGPWNDDYCFAEFGFDFE